MQRRAFEHSLSELLRAPVEGLSTAEKLDLVGRHAAALTAQDGLQHFSAGFVPFVPGRRPIDEVAYPGLRSSQQTALYHLGRTDDELALLVRCSHRGRPTAGFPMRPACSAPSRCSTTRAPPWASCPVGNAATSGLS